MIELKEGNLCPMCLLSIMQQVLLNFVFVEGVFIIYNNEIEWFKILESRIQERNQTIG